MKDRVAPSRSPKGQNLEERMQEFLDKTNRPSRRSRSPYYDSRNKKHRTHSRSRSPIVATNNKEFFLEKLKLQAAGLWTNQLEEKWIIVEAEECL